MNKHINDLLNVGLTEYESRAYLTLIRNGNLTATEISKNGNIPRTKIYFVLENLVKKGLAIRVPGKFKKYSVVQPENGFSRFFEELDNKKVFLESVIGSLNNLFLKQKAVSNTFNNIEVLEGVEHIESRLKTIHAESKNEIICVHKQPYSDFVDNCKHHGSLRKNIKYRLIFEKCECKSIKFAEFLESIEESNTNIKISKKPQIRFIIYDSEIVFLSLEEAIINKTNFSTQGVLIKNENIANFFRDVFNNMARKGISISEYKKLLTKD